MNRLALKAEALAREALKADSALVKRLSLKGQLRCLSLGILGNGLGPMGMPRGGAGGLPLQQPPT